MSLTVLVSFSLLALVVTARPVPDNAQFAYAHPAELQSAVQAIFESRNKQSAPDILNLSDGDVHVHFTSAKDQQAYLSQLDDSAVKALVPIGESEDGVVSEDVKKLYEMLGGSERLDDVEGASRPVEDTDMVDAEEDETEVQSDATEVTAATPVAVHSTRPIAVIAFSAALAFLTVLCVGVSLYAWYYLRASLFASRTAWDLLPKLEKQQLPESTDVDERLSDEKASALGLVLQGPDDEKLQVPVGILVDLDVDASTTDDEFHDALDDSNMSTPRANPSSLPSFAPLLIPLPPSPSPSPLRKPLDLRDDDTSPRPAWAVLAPEDQPRPRGAAPALDFALAMQLRLGLGFGSDPAWLVRFLVAMFGWVAMLMGTGRGERTQQRRLVGL
ncbi:hypothetical protein BV25DRAFT_1827716 [Artomyces pyxidatus]|uniref:Uncharacterized protein n=1 Tax=Artomyces pyxidatus TaxID=48021 RepID=A0ACB8SWG4_9AGAM|nr:hypothetical protein BV25DRAFT_1827716 [Artomyces pyxidatus]